MSEFSQRSLVAVQYGSHVVAAKWLDLTRTIRAKKCFDVEIAEGQIPSVQGIIIFLDCMEKTVVASMSEPTLPSNDTLKQWLQRVSEGDESITTLEHAITGLQGPRTMRLVTLICTESSKRIVDPTDT